MPGRNKIYNIDQDLRNADWLKVLQRDVDPDGKEIVPVIEEKDETTGDDSEQATKSKR